MAQTKKGKDSESNKDKWNKEEDPLQAVVIADSFNSKFLPITLEKPRVRKPRWCGGVIIFRPYFRSYF